MCEIEGLTSLELVGLTNPLTGPIPESNRLTGAIPERLQEIVMMR